MRPPRNLTLYYIYLASGCAVLGTLITFAVILACEYFQIDIMQHLWVLAIPVTLSLILNICFLELLRKFWKG